MKNLFIIIIFVDLLFSTEIDCKFKYSADSIYNLSSEINSSIITSQGELEDNLIYGDIDPANSEIVYWDNNSPICGGSSEFNRLVEAYCDTSLNSSCWDITKGSTGYQTIIKNSELKYTNNVILVNGYPCLPYNISSVTVGFYDYDNNDIGFATFNLNKIFNETITSLTKEEQKYQRDMCPNLISYIDDLERLKTEQYNFLNTDLNSINLLNIDIDTTLQNLDNTLENLSNTDSSDSNDNYDGVIDDFEVNPDISSELSIFKNDIENKIENSFSSYSDVFGLGGYAPAPAPITLNLFGKSFALLDMSLVDDYIPTFRDLLLTFSYFAGFIIFIRTIK